MADKKGFTIEVSSSFKGFWRYNTILMCGCFDSSGDRTDFAANGETIAEVGANLAKCPKEYPAKRTTSLTTSPCAYIVLYLYIIPHTLPTESDVSGNKPFDLDISISYDGHELHTEKRAINQWSGASIELTINAGELS